MTSLPSTASEVADPFRQDTTNVMTRLRGAIRPILGQGEDGKLRIREIQKRFGIDFQLSWKVYRIVSAKDSAEAAPHVPDPAAMRRLLAAFHKAGINAEAITAVEDAYAAYEQQVGHYAEDRSTFDQMVAQSLGGDMSAEVELEHRRSIMEAYRYIEGVTQDSLLYAQIIHGSATVPDGFDLVTLRARTGLWRMNRQKPIIINAFRANVATPASGEPGPAVGFVPLDPLAFQQFGAAILPTFSSPDLPLQVEPLANGIVTTRLLSQTIGRNNKIDVVFGEKCVNGPFLLSKNNAFTTFFYIPMKATFHDILVHRSTVGPMDATTTRWGHPGVFPSMDANFKPHKPEEAGYPPLPCREQLTYIGTGTSAAQLSEVPRYLELLQYACTQMNWNLEEFDIYRLQIQFPLMYSTVVIKCSFPTHRSAPSALTP